MRLYSKRNDVFLVGSGPSARVEKHFRRTEDWEHELAVYRRSSGRLSIPKLFEARERVLVMEYLPLPTLLDVLEAQERDGFCPEPWEALARWVRQCRVACGMIVGDGNLRNFLWNALENRCVGLDFEEYRQGELPEAGADLIAYLMEYDPVGTLVKKKAAAVLRSALGASEDDISAVRQELRRRRSAERGERLR